MSREHGGKKNLLRFVCFGVTLSNGYKGIDGCCSTMCNIYRKETTTKIETRQKKLCLKTMTSVKIRKTKLAQRFGNPLPHVQLLYSALSVSY